MKKDEEQKKEICTYCMYNVYQDNYKNYFPSPHFREGKKRWCEFRIQTFYLRISGKTELEPKLHI